LSDPNPTLAQIDERIALIEDNLRDLVEEAAAYSGAGDDELSASRIAEQEQALEALKKQREDLA
jgi:hypothetical protein